MITSGVAAIVLAAGSSQRFESPGNKVFQKLGQQSLLWHSLHRFAEHPAIGCIVVTAAEADHSMITNLIQSWSLPKTGEVVLGGFQRGDSVWSGLSFLDAEPPEWVCIHDAARPLFSFDLLQRLLEKVEETGAAIPALPVKDTIKIADSSQQVRKTLCRKELYAVQTPQVFSFSLIFAAYQKHATKLAQFTDDASLLEAEGKIVSLVPGEETNLKITTTTDLLLARALWEDRQKQNK